MRLRRALRPLAAVRRRGAARSAGQSVRERARSYEPPPRPSRTPSRATATAGTITTSATPIASVPRSGPAGSRRPQRAGTSPAAASYSPQPRSRSARRIGSSTRYPRATQRCQQRSGRWFGWDVHVAGDTSPVRERWQDGGGQLLAGLLELSGRQDSATGSELGAQRRLGDTHGGLPKMKAVPILRQDRVR